MLNSKQKKYLKIEAMSLSAIFQVGKDGVHENLIDGIDEALTARELVKIKLLDTCPMTVNNVALDVSMYTHSDVVDIIGHTIVFYRKSEKRLYQLP